MGVVVAYRNSVYSGVVPLLLATIISCVIQQQHREMESFTLTCTALRMNRRVCCKLYAYLAVFRSSEYVLKSLLYCAGISYRTQCWTKILNASVLEQLMPEFSGARAVIALPTKPTSLARLKMPTYRQIFCVGHS